MRPFLKIFIVLTILLLCSQDLSGVNRKGFLSIHGDKVLDGSRNTVFLHGFNIAFKDFKDVLGESDIKRIADTGANSVRLVLDYRYLESGHFKYNSGNFSLLDSVINWCDKYNVYVILDMHLAPGIQNPHDFVVHRETKYEFWKKREYQERFYGLWAEIAKRYADRSIIAGYDLLNEGVAPSTEDYLRVMNNAANTIRSYDKNHILIVEEAWSPDSDDKRLVLIGDKNTMYSFHFFYPVQFTFYTTTNKRILTSYPGEMVNAGDKIGEARSESIKGTGEWRKISIKAVPPEGAEILVVHISSNQNRGAIWVDDVYLERGGKEIELPARLIPNNSFEIDYSGINWETRGSNVTVNDRVARTGKHSLMFSNSETLNSAESSPMEVQKGEYLLTAWVKSRDAGGNNYLSLSWHKRKALEYVDKKKLYEMMKYALDFKSKNKIPLYVGEFTAHANPSSDSVVNYLIDLLEIMRDEGLHWSYWTYYSEYPGIGICIGDKPRISRFKGLEALKRYMK